MTSSQIVTFFEARPFEPFTLVLADGREVHLHHPAMGSIGDHVMASSSSTRLANLK